MRAIWILTLLAFLAAGQGPDRAAIQLQAAIKTEVFDGNLKGAIEQYRKIIDTYKSNRPVVAEALVRMAQCHEKLGDVQAREARSTYERVVREFADQAEPAAQARARLAALASGSNRAAAENTGIRIRQVWTDIPRDIDPNGSPSPDGRSFAYISGGDSKSSGYLVIRDLPTGVDRRVANLCGDPLNADVQQPLWSPQGNIIAYYAWIKMPSPKEEIRLYDLKADKTRTLVSGQGSYPLGWSMDGKHLLITRSENKTRAIGLVSIDSDRFRPVKSVSSDEASIYGGDLSPDGRWIAYASSKKGTANFDVVVIDASTGQETCRIEHPSNEFLLGWTRDGGYLLFQSYRTGTAAVWAQRVENGKAVSEPVLIKPGVGYLRPLGFSANGAFFYLTAEAGTDIYLSEMDFSEGRMTAPRKLVLDHEGSNSHCAFSPDGRHLAYLTFRGVVRPESPYVGNPLKDTICLYSLETGNIRQYTIQMRICYFSSCSLEWSSDSRYIFFQATTPPEINPIRTSLYRLDVNTDEIGAVGRLSGGHHITCDGKTVIADFNDIESNTWRLVRRDLQTGVETELYTKEASYKGVARVSGGAYFLGSDGNTIFLYFLEQDKTLRIVRRDMQTGTETDLYRSTILSSPTLSPDAAFLAVWDREKSAEGKVQNYLSVVSTADGTRRIPFSEGSRQIYWVPNRRSLLVTGQGNPEGANLLYSLWQVPVDGQPPRKIEPRISNLRSLTFHPDGKQIAFTLGVGPGGFTGHYQVWEMENFLPPAKESKK